MGATAAEKLGGKLQEAICDAGLKHCRARGRLLQDRRLAGQEQKNSNDLSRGKAQLGAVLDAIAGRGRP